ncbi:MAG: LytTR family DNA-binding domain-containing protein [Flavobacteriales bacterium]|jgi:two-component system LytT family response regulator|nr:LytTR family DNA-binding domain-containing protein [Flavobacteriales bacterium]
MKLKTVIIDDEQMARDVMKNYLQNYCEEQVELVQICDGFKSAVSYLNKNQVDLVFLDVEMPFGNGLDVLETLGDYDFKVIFTTAFDHYAIEALHAHAFDYLLKPISIKKLVKSVQDVHDLKEKNPKIEKQSIYLKISSQRGFELIPKSEIIFIQAADNYCEVHTLDSKKYLLSKTLKKVEQELFSDDFIRIHKSYLVNWNQIQRYERQYGGSIFLKNGKEIPISLNGKKLLNERLKF